MEALRSLLRHADLQPVVAGLLLALIALRYGVVFSLRGRRALRERKAIAPQASLRELALEWLDPGLVVVLLALFVIRPYIAQVRDAAAPGMEPTLRYSRTPQIDGPNDQVLVTKYLLKLRPPRRGEVVLIATPDPTAQPLLRRLIALPGETVEIDERGRLVVQGQALAEPYVTRPARLPFPRRQVPAGCYFVLGDNRNPPAGQSKTSGLFLPTDHVRGKAVAICWPPQRIRLLP